MGYQHINLLIYSDMNDMFHADNSTEPLITIAFAASVMEKKK